MSSYYQYFLCHALICFYFIYLQVALIAKRLALAVADTPPLDVKGSSLVLVFVSLHYTFLQFTFARYFNTVCITLSLCYLSRCVNVPPHIKLHLFTRKLYRYNTTFKVLVLVRVRITHR
jgi:hypothetical protein